MSVYVCVRDRVRVCISTFLFTLQLECFRVLELQKCALKYAFPESEKLRVSFE